MAEHVDWVVIGSGFGGSVCALRLAEKGYRVRVLEKGRRFAPEDFPKANWDLRRWLWLPGLGLRGFFQMSFLRHATVFHGVGSGFFRLITLPHAPSAFMAEATELARRWAEKARGVTATMFTETLLGVPSTAHVLGGCCMGGRHRRGRDRQRPPRVRLRQSARDRRRRGQRQPGRQPGADDRRTDRAGDGEGAGEGSPGVSGLTPQRQRADAATALAQHGYAGAHLIASPEARA